MKRPLFHRSISELEEAAEKNRQNVVGLALIDAELAHRTTQRAKELRNKIAGWRQGFAIQNNDEGKMHSGAADMNCEDADLKIDPEIIENTQQAVADLRKRLIDLSRKSPLINFRHGGRSASILRIVDERPDLVYETILKQGMGFEPLPDRDDTPRDEQTDEFRIAYEKGRLVDPEFLAATDDLGERESDAEAMQIAERALRSRIRKQLGLPHLDYGKSLDIKAFAKANGVNPSFDLASSDEEREEHHEDDQLRVLLTEKELQKRLKAIWDKYRSHYRETGIHTLYLAFGFVEWEDDTSRGPNHAPTLLLAVELHREIKRGRYEYTLNPHDEGLQVNIALAEKMREHWGLEAPELREGESPESYWVRLLNVLNRGRDLSLRKFVTLAVLPFPQMILWKDLDPENWEEDAFGTHPLLPAMMGAAPVSGDPSPSEPYDIDSLELTREAPALVRPADASQHSAIIETAQGSDLAIEGPPGTGKSETITNIIADAVSRGKKVLFVAEKQAALQVVANRLRETGLGALALELHGENANRTKVYDDLRQRLSANARHDRRHLTLQRGRLQEKREELRTYLEHMREEPGLLERSVYQLVWRQVHLREKVEDKLWDNLSAYISCADPRAVERAELESVRSRLTVFGEAIESLSSHPRTPWLRASNLPVFDQKEPLRLAATASESNAAFVESLSSFASLAEFNIPGPDDDLEPAITQLSSFEPFVDISTQEAKAALCVPDNSRTALRLQTRYRRLGEKLSEDLRNPSTCDRETLATFDQDYSTMENPPLSFEEARQQAEATDELSAAAKKAAPAVKSCLELLGLGENLSLSSLKALAETVLNLGEQPANVRALIRKELLDPMIEVAFEQERSQAASISSDSDTLEHSLLEDAYDADPGEMQELADIMENAGFFARLFSSEYKSAMRRSARLLRDSAERMQAVQTLREAARFRRKAIRFRDASAAKSLFPEIMWKGHESDFSALEAAWKSLREAKNNLSDAQIEPALGIWLSLDASGRDKATDFAKQFCEIVTALIDETSSESDYSAAVSAMESRWHQLNRLLELLEKIGATDGCQIVRDGENVAARVATFDGCRAEFESLISEEGLSWIETIEQPLDGLGRALEQVDRTTEKPDPLGILAALKDSECPLDLASDIDAARNLMISSAQDWETARWHLKEETGLDLQLAPDCEMLALDGWTDLQKILARLKEDPVGAREAAKLLSEKAELNELGLAGLCEAAISGDVEPTQLADAYELRVISELLKAHLHTDGIALQRMGGLKLTDARRQFVKIDQELHELEAQAILAERLADRPEIGVGHGRRSNFTEMSLLDNELGLKRPRTPLRDVIHRAGNALQALKPVWMMSPASAAQYIRPGSVDFDLLIVDEASQMRPEFAISAIMRAKQFVVVGDTKQLPPSDHFSAAAVKDDGDDAIGIDADAESILDVANQRFRRKRRLKWHYRSRHESLIKFSNRQFYDDDLVVFPSPSGDGDDLLGAKLFYVPDLKPGTFYQSSINQKEAEAVLEEALRLMTEYPEYSLGIAAMNAQQAELLNIEFDRLRLEHKAIDRYVEAFNGTVEEFFIKNLENVQGDERDIILISTVYGPDQDGIVKQNFGLMNREVGWRRLNVLVTRAKFSIRVFTSLRPGDIKVTPSSSTGIRAFHDYLAYLNQQPTGDEPEDGFAESDFEWVVAERLRAEGYECVPQVGVNRFRIDIGVRHPDCRDVFLAGIECDGAPYHSGFTVRDRDRIRQQVLEGLNWKIWRIWSVDWYQDPEREMEKLLAWLNDQKAQNTEVDPPKTADSADSPTANEATNASSAASSSAAEGFSSDEEDSAQPEGRPLRPLDGIEWYEKSKGRIYTIWEDGVQKGHVTVLSRATQAPRLYGGAVAIQQSEYEATIERTGEKKQFNDLFDAVRYVGKANVAELISR